MRKGLNEVINDFCLVKQTGHGYNGDDQWKSRSWKIPVWKDFSRSPDGTNN